MTSDQKQCRYEYVGQENFCTQRGTKEEGRVIIRKNVSLRWD